MLAFLCFCLLVLIWILIKKECGISFKNEIKKYNMNLLFNVKLIVLDIKRPKIEQQLIMKKNKTKTAW